MQNMSTRCRDVDSKIPSLRITVWHYSASILSYDVASESVIKPCIKNDNPLVD